MSSDIFARRVVTTLLRVLPPENFPKCVQQEKSVFWGALQCCTVCCYFFIIICFILSSIVMLLTSHFDMAHFLFCFIFFSVTEIVQQ